MLLLVIDAKLDELAHPRMPLGRTALEQRLKPGVDVAPKMQDFIEARAREKPALGARLSWPCRLVVGIKAVGEALIEAAEANKVRLEHEGLEEPGRVGKMPLRGTGIIHGLDDLVFGAQGLRECAGEPPRLPHTLSQW